MSQWFERIAPFLIALSGCVWLAQPALADNPPHQGALGISLAPAQDGVRVIAVVPGGPADKAGVLLDDEIGRIGNQPVQSIENFIAIVRRCEPGTQIDLRVSRDGGLYILKAQLAAVESVFGQADRQLARVPNSGRYSYQPARPGSAGGFVQPAPQIGMPTSLRGIPLQQQIEILQQQILQNQQMMQQMRAYQQDQTYRQNGPTYDPNGNHDPAILQ